MYISNIFYLGIKELRSLKRDRMMVILILYAFTFSIYIAATSLPEILNKAPISIVDEDSSQLSKRIADAFYPPYFTRPSFIYFQEMDQRLNNGFDTFSIIIPPNFQKDLLAGRTPEIQVNVDATRMTQAFSGNGYIHSIITNEIIDFMQGHKDKKPPEIDLSLRARFNPELKDSWFGSVMELISNITMLSIILTGAALIREREHGTVEHLLVMPITPFEIMISKVWSMALVVLATSICSLFIIIKYLLAVPIAGSIFLFTIGAALHLFATTSLGIFLATIARSMPQFGLLLILVLLPIEILSGGITPRESMPGFIQMLMLASPNTHFVLFSQDILYRGAGISVVWPKFLSLAIIGSILFMLSLTRFRRTLRLIS
jgi:ABC-2 type transport system permease protein